MFSLQRIIGMNNVQELTKLNKHFTELREILIRENENNWIRGVNAILNTLHFALEDNDDVRDTIRSVGNTYSRMNSGNGSFSDFYIQREDFDERVEANKELSKIKNNITDLIASCR